MPRPMKVESIITDIAIKGFFGEYRFLSNYHVCNIMYDGRLFKSSEHAYQAAKTSDLDELTKIQNSPEPNDAKKLGKKIKNLRPFWDEIKYGIMEDICYYKFKYNEDIKDKLLNTGDKYLEETNWWNDQYWGVCNNVGENNLGKILMDIRKRLRK